MNDVHQIRVVGLTGGIASGKSTVASLLAAQGVPVIYADQLSREVTRPGQIAYQQIASRWPQVIGANEEIDRAKLGELVFADAAQLRELTDMVMPCLLEAFKTAKQHLAQQGYTICVFEAATLFEEHLENWVDGVLVVSVSANEQIRRLAQRNGFTEAQARQRLAVQWPLSEKLRRARWVLENGADLSELQEKVGGVWQRIEKELSKEAP